MLGVVAGSSSLPERLRFLPRHSASVMPQESVKPTFQFGNELSLQVLSSLLAQSFWSQELEKKVLILGPGSATFTYRLKVFGTHYLHGAIFLVSVPFLSNFVLLLSRWAITTSGLSPRLLFSATGGSAFV